MPVTPVFLHPVTPKLLRVSLPPFLVECGLPEVGKEVTPFAWLRKTICVQEKAGKEANLEEKCENFRRNIWYRPGNLASKSFLECSRAFSLHGDPKSFFPPEPCPWWVCEKWKNFLFLKVIHRDFLISFCKYCCFWTTGLFISWEVSGSCLGSEWNTKILSLSLTLFLSLPTLSPHSLSLKIQWTFSPGSRVLSRWKLRVSLALFEL